jgi:hypothetical protein
VIVGGQLAVKGTGAKFAISSDGKNWDAVTDSLDKFFSPDAPARYEYRLRCELPPEARVERLRIVNDLQMSPLVLPAMSIGENSFVYSDETKGERNVVLTHGWVERSSSTPPPAVTTPIFPADGGETSGTDIAFQWTAPTMASGAANAAGAKIADYHFELSDRLDMKWPLSTNFYKLISRTADRGQAQYTLPAAGLLAPDHRYYWRVRAKNGQGVWGPWSKVWSFTPRAPSYPLEVTLSYDPAKNEGTLHWKPNPAGRPAVKYRIYGSDEKGFSTSDVPYQVDIGATRGLAGQFPANFIAETGDTELAVLGTGVKLSNANKTYYRVIAVDAEGKRSGASDYAAAPRPVIYSEPPVAARVGGDYQYQPHANRSLGDLKARDVDGREVRAFFEIEAPKYTIVKGPAWLKIDPATGALSGRPEAVGKYEVSILATIEREQRKLDEAALAWGNYKLLEASTEKLAGAPQLFTIEVTP